ncbi:helix-turn-helix transcriptional regulator [Mycobacterium hubeiense]|uniref:helix-turn-helix transcriptional regulator n=1 Tax=Mycobacterium hubeiense TaxID=1867256 RepID=UPI001E582458|nr:helix-turn-helix transcriptional regulator [Mycobacterium sp. QGD 101]
MRASPDPLNKVIAVWAKGGRLAGSCDGIEAHARPGDVSLVTQPDLPHDVQARDLSVTSVVMDPGLVASVATGTPDSDAKPIRFFRFEPVDTAAGRLWQDTVRYVHNSVLVDDDLVNSLVLGHAGRLLAAVTLTAFPNSAMTEPTSLDATDTHPALLRRAVEYMEANVANDIGLADIAQAVHVTPRAVQYMFRRHLDVTPLQYLRRQRLEYARRDLLNADRARETVTDIAARWGFLHTGRFAVMYRQAFGESPHATLRR